jgi:hypothetical protein
VRIKLVFKGVLSANQSFKGGEWLLCAKLAYSARVKHMHITNENHYLEVGASGTLFSVRIEYVLVGIPRVNYTFQGGERLILFQIGLFI